MLPSKSITPFLGIWDEGTEPVRSVNPASGKTAVNEKRFYEQLRDPVHQHLQQRTSIILRVSSLVKALLNLHQISQTPDIWLCLLVQQTGTNTFINGGLSAAVNAIGTHLRDPINSGLTRWCMMLDAAAELRRNPVSKDQMA